MSHFARVSNVRVRDRKRRTRRKKRRNDINADLFDSSDEENTRVALTPDSYWRELQHQAYLRRRMREGAYKRHVRVIDDKGREVSLAERIVRFQLSQSQESSKHTEHTTLSDNKEKAYKLRSLLQQYIKQRHSEQALCSEFIGQMNVLKTSLRDDELMLNSSRDVQSQSISLGDSATDFNLKANNCNMSYIDEKDDRNTVVNRGDGNIKRKVNEMERGTSENHEHGKVNHDLVTNKMNYINEPTLIGTKAVNEEDGSECKYNSTEDCNLNKKEGAQENVAHTEETQYIILEKKKICKSDHTSDECERHLKPFSDQHTELKSSNDTENKGTTTERIANEYSVTDEYHGTDNVRMQIESNLKYDKEQENMSNNASHSQADNFTETKHINKESFSSTNDNVDSYLHDAIKDRSKTFIISRTSEVDNSDELPLQNKLNNETMTLKSENCILRKNKLDEPTKHVKKSSMDENTDFYNKECSDHSDSYVDEDVTISNPIADCSQQFLSGVRSDFSSSSPIEIRAEKLTKEENDAKYTHRHHVNGGIENIDPNGSSLSFKIQEDDQYNCYESPLSIVCGKIKSKDVNGDDYIIPQNSRYLSLVEKNCGRFPFNRNDRCVNKRIISKTKVGGDEVSLPCIRQSNFKPMDRERNEYGRPCHSISSLCSHITNTLKNSNSFRNPVGRKASICETNNIAEREKRIRDLCRELKEFKVPHRYANDLDENNSTCCCSYVDMHVEWGFMEAPNIPRRKRLRHVRSPFSVNENQGVDSTGENYFSNTPSVPTTNCQGGQKCNFIYMRDVSFCRFVHNSMSENRVRKYLSPLLNKEQNDGLFEKQKWRAKRNEGTKRIADLQKSDNSGRRYCVLPKLKSRNGKQS